MTTKNMFKIFENQMTILNAFNQNMTSLQLKSMLGFVTKKLFIQFNRIQIFEFHSFDNAINTELVP